MRGGCLQGLQSFFVKQSRPPILRPELRFGGLMTMAINKSELRMCSFGVGADRECDETGALIGATVISPQSTM